MRIFILEDDSTRVNSFIELFYKHDLTITENAYDAVEMLGRELFDLIFLDHDLGDGNGSGSYVSSYLRENPENMNNDVAIVIHSWNIPATESMMKDLPGSFGAPFNTVAFFDLLHEMRLQ